MTVTQFAKGKSPWEPKAKRAKAAFTDLSDLEVGDDPLPSNRIISTEKKYDAKFSSLKPGQCLKCPAGDVGKIANAMRVWISRVALKDHVVRSCTNYDSSEKPGRVWLINLGPGRKKIEVLQ
jgi:hypothetical protein